MSDASSSSEYDAFLTHDWGDDELGRSNHARVAEVNRLLKAAGFVTWFDEDRMQGDIVSQMANGIDSSAAVLVFVTENYCIKVAGAGRKGPTTTAEGVRLPRAEGHREDADGTVVAEAWQLDTAACAADRPRAEARETPTRETPRRSEQASVVRRRRLRLVLA